MTGILRVVALLAVFAVSTGVAQLPPGYKIVKPYICQPGTHLELDCNYCVCSANPGVVGSCTMMECSLAPDECIPGTYFEIEEQLCSCPDTSFKWDSDCFSKDNA